MSSYQRADRVADAVKKEIAEIISRDIQDPRVRLVTITQVRMSPDLRSARVFFTTIDPDADLDAIVKGLKRAAGFVQRKLGARVQLRYTPQVSFVYDASLAAGARMDNILKGIEKELESREDPEET